jgi:hypothetical protein
MLDEVITSHYHIQCHVASILKVCSARHISHISYDTPVAGQRHSDDLMPHSVTHTFQLICVSIMCFMVSRGSRRPYLITSAIARFVPQERQYHRHSSQVKQCKWCHRTYKMVGHYSTPHTVVTCKTQVIVLWECMYACPDMAFLPPLCQVRKQ